MADVILAIDQGTTGTTVALMDASGRLLNSVNHEFPQYYPQPGWVEHDPNDKELVLFRREARELITEPEAEVPQSELAESTN